MIRSGAGAAARRMDMRVRSLSAIVVTGVPLLMAGCPLGLDLGSLLDFGFFVWKHFG